MQLQPTSLAELWLAETERHSDARGSFARWFCAQELAPVLGQRHIVQVNHSVTARVGAIRGLHFQYSPAAEMKLVRCLSGAVFDVAVDLRPTSSSYLHWHGEQLRAGDDRLLVIPEGFAHGFQVLEPDSELLYLHTAAYDPVLESGLRYDDPALAIDWPLPESEVSERDRGHALVADGFDGVRL